MAYCLNSDEPLAEGFKRIAEEQMGIAIQHLQQRDVYEARKCLKRLRALLRLLEPQLGPLATEENHRLRDIARRFGGLRDTDVSLEVLEGFAALYKRKSTLNPQRHALTEKQNCLKQQTGWQTAVTESLETLTATRRRIEDWPLVELDQNSLNSQLKRTHKQGRNALKRVNQTHTVEDFHELRKCVKREFNQLKLFDSDSEALNRLKRLGTLLGDHHNLAVLMLNLQTASGRFRALVRRRQRLQESEILPLASQVYKETLI